MIRTRTDLHEYIKEDNQWYREKKLKRKVLNVLTCQPYYDIKRYLIYLRKYEYHYNNAKGNRYHTYMGFYYERKKNRLGRLLGIEIGPNCFGKGLSMWHYGTIIVNPEVRAGNYCTLHGNNCLGNNGKSKGTPIIGNYVDIGFGATIIGNISVANNTVIGANSVVNRTITEEDGVYVGSPAHRV